MDRCFCIHGHFYQPPREDPWLEEVFPEGSAAPMRHWNERIARESYAPLAWAKRLDHEGRILDMLNAYEWMSFNVGPTLLSWMERMDPRTYARIVEADAASLKRLGHGNALAQAYHHVILPLASPLDKEVEVVWAIADFEARFGRRPEGMWLPEAAVDSATLEVLARHGIRFTVLAPRQAEAVADLDSDDWRPVSESELDVFEPYRAALASGASVDIFFYHGPLSQAVAFEGLPRNGEHYWGRVAGCSRPGLLSLSTDGETYGHHVPFGEMALAYVLAQARSGRDGIQLTNYAAFLDERPPRRKVRLREPSSWSCVHGVERWRTNCGCTTGGHPEWNQRWRAPLRLGLDQVKAGVDAHYFDSGIEVFQDPMAALLAYGRVLAGSESRDAFARAHVRGDGAPERLQKAFSLLEMQRWALASFASCAWFFDEISRIEPLNGLTAAVRAMELASSTGAPDLSGDLAEILAAAQSNRPDRGTGKDLFERQAAPRRETAGSVVAQALLWLWAEDRLPDRGETASVAWPGVEAAVSLTEEKGCVRQGAAELAWARCGASERVEWRWEAPCDGNPLETRLEIVHGVAPDVFRLEDLSWGKRQALAVAWMEHWDEAAWADAEQRLDSCSGLFLGWEEEQEDQILAWRWGRHWAILAWLYVQGSFPGDRRGQSVARFLRLRAGCAGETEVLARRIMAAALDRLDRFPCPFGEVEALIARTGELEIPVDWWPLQARVWEMGLDGTEIRSLARLVGFRV